jgi:long-subunit fatty acid transport protein
MEMNLRRPLSILSPFMVFFACCPQALAFNSNSNRQIIPLGEAFMGNAGVGRATDTGAVYYNPAGLTDMTSGRVSVSSSVYADFNYRYDGAFYIDSTNVGYKASGFNTIPSFYAASYKLADWYAALSILVPNSLQFENRVPFTTLSTNSDIVQTLRTSDLWLGLSLAHKIDERWSLGVSLFGIQHQEAQTLGTDIQYPAAPLANLNTGLDQTTLSTMGLSAVVGVSFVATDWLRFGLRAQTALIQVYGQADTYEANHTVKAGAITTTGENLQGTPANYRLPFDFTLGTALTPSDWFALLVDVSLQLGASYDSIPGSLLSESVDLSPTPRVNVGLEFKPAQWMPLRFGFYYNPSANGGDQTVEGYETENFTGLTAGLSVKTAKVETGVGGFYIWSSGQVTPYGAPGTTSPASIRGVGGLLTASYIL